MLHTGYKLLGKLNDPLSQIQAQEHFWLMIAIFPRKPMTWWTFSARPPVHTPIHPYLLRPSRKQKDREDSVLRGGSPPFLIWGGRHKAYYLPVTATNYCWLPSSASSSTRMNGQTQASLSLSLSPVVAYYSFRVYVLQPSDVKVANTTCSLWPPQV